MKKSLKILALVVGVMVIFAACGQKSMSKTEALSRVKNLPEVQEYMELLEKAGAKAEITAEDWSDVWGVQVFEITREDETAPWHTATFGWYEVDKATGAIAPQTP